MKVTALNLLRPSLLGEHTTPVEEEGIMAVVDLGGPGSVRGFRPAGIGAYYFLERRRSVLESIEAWEGHGRVRSAAAPGWLSMHWS